MDGLIQWPKTPFMLPPGFVDRDEARRFGVMNPVSTGKEAPQVRRFGVMNYPVACGGGGFHAGFVQGTWRAFASWR